jgi:cobalamin 5'-phosphate synthase/cobalamin synthase
MNSTLPLALTFLTKLPWPWRGPADETALARSMFWFPWVGALLGLGFWAAWAGLMKILPAPAAAGLLLTLTVWLTGGLHLDGLADTADGLGGGRTREETLAIMKDSRVGAFGVISLILGLVLKFSLFLSLATQIRGTGVLLLFPIISRWSMVLLAYLSPYARAEGGLGQAMTLGVSPRVLMGASLSAGGLALLILGAPGLVLFIAAGALVWLGRLYFQRRLGGITGDILGATNEVVEIMVLAGALMLT